MAEPQFDYTSRDYASIRQALIDNIPTFMPEWVTRSPADFGIVMLELFAYMGDLVNYGMDRIVNEAYLKTAARRQSVLNLAELYDYRPGTVAPATVTLTFTISNGTQVTIPAGTKVTTASVLTSAPIIFETDSAITIGNEATPQTIKTVTATEGTAISNESVGTSSGNKDQTFPLLYTPPVISSLSVIVDEDGSGPNNYVQWTRVDHLVDYGADDRVYATTVDESNILTIKFGDGVNGKIPPVGATIAATYRVSQGSIGNVGVNTLTQLAVPITNVLTVTNQVEASGGTDPESITSIKAALPKSLRALNRAVTTSDYASLALQVAGVAKAAASASVYTSVSLYVAPVGGGTATAALKNNVGQYLADKKMAGVSVTVLDPSYLDINITAAIVVLAQYNRTAVQASVDSALRALLAFDSVDLGQRLTLSSVYRAISAVTGVDYATVSVLDSGVSTSALADVVLTTNQIPQVGTIALSSSGGILGS